MSGIGWILQRRILLVHCAPLLFGGGLAGCVDLSKPSPVAVCASSVEGCANGAKADAAIQIVDTNVVKPDTTVLGHVDQSIPVVPIEGPWSNPDSMGDIMVMGTVVGTDGAGNTGTSEEAGTIGLDLSFDAMEINGEETGLGSSTEPGAEVAPEAGPGPGPEIGPEPRPEPGPEAGPESGPEPAPEPGPEAGPEPGPEPGPEAGPEPVPEPGPEPGPDAALDTPPLVDCTIFFGASPSTGSAGHPPQATSEAAFCVVTCDDIAGWGCSNLGNRSVMVNGSQLDCGVAVSKQNGYYVFRVSAGTPTYTSLYWWVDNNAWASSCPSPDGGVFP